MYVSVVKKEHMLKLKIFAPQTPFSIHSSHGMETSVMKKCSLLKLQMTDKPMKNGRKYVDSRVLCMI